MPRLVLMSRFGMDLPTDIIEEQIATALDFIVMSQRLADGSRVITSLSEVGQEVRGKVHLGECVSFDLASRTWTLVFEPAFVERGVEEGVLCAEEVRAWRSSLRLAAA